MPHGCKEQTLEDPLKESQVILTSEPALQPRMNSSADVSKASSLWSEIPMSLFTHLLSFSTDSLTAPLSVRDLLHLPSFPVLKKLLQDRSRNNCPHVYVSILHFHSRDRSDSCSTVWTLHTSPEPDSLSYSVQELQYFLSGVYSASYMQALWKAGTLSLVTLVIRSWTEPYSCHSFSRQSRSSFLASVDITGVMTSALEFQNLCSQFIIRSLLSRRTFILLHRVPPTRPYKFLNSHGVVKINTQ